MTQKELNKAINFLSKIKNESYFETEQEKRGFMSAIRALVDEEQKWMQY